MPVRPTRQGSLPLNRSSKVLDWRKQLPNGETLADFLPYLMNVVMAQANARLDQRLRKTLGIPFQMWRVLLVLSGHGTLHINILAEATAIPQATLSRVLQRMERKKLIVRTVAKGDGRINRISLSERGEQMFGEAFPHGIDEGERLLRGFSLATQKALRRGFQTILPIS
jgi:DNA-binding MarR family transcriptional regulator